jgi:carbonic anhydrase
VLGVTCVNLLAGVGIGLGLSVFFLLRRLSNTDVQMEQREGKWHVKIGGTLTFASVPRLNGELSSIPPGHNVDIDLAVDFIDHAAFEALHVDIDETHEEWYKPAKDGTPRRGKSLPTTAK